MNINSKPIGGYFGLETNKLTTYPHPNCVLVNSGRHALEYILRTLPEKAKSVWLPYYTCEVILQPLHKLGISFKFYEIDHNLHIKDYPKLKHNEYIIANNYFGLFDDYMASLVGTYGSQLIIDNSQAWYASYIEGTMQFFSPRKFFGVADGGLAYTPFHADLELKTSVSFHRMSHLLKRIDLGASEGYDDFHKNSETLKNEPLMEMSMLTKSILQGIDYNQIKEIRRNNYQQLHEALCKTNGLRLPEADEFSCPMVYPFLSSNKNLRGDLIANKIFVAKYWPNIEKWREDGTQERAFAELLLPLPIDQRYNSDDIQRIINIVKHGC